MAQNLTPIYHKLVTSNAINNYGSPDIQNTGGVYSDSIEYDLPQDEGYKSNPITFLQYLANMTVKTGKYSGDQLFHAIF